MAGWFGRLFRKRDPQALSKTSSDSGDGGVGVILAATLLSDSKTNDPSDKGDASSGHDSGGDSGGGDGGGSD